MNTLGCIQRANDSNHARDDGGQIHRINLSTSLKHGHLLKDLIMAAVLSHIRCKPGKLGGRSSGLGSGLWERKSSGFDPH